MLTLGIETSCDDTSIAVLENGKNILSNVTFSQHHIHEKKGGIVPEEAAREHSKNIDIVYKEAMYKAGLKIKDINCIAVTYAPGLISSLAVGVSFARALSFSYDISLIPIHHIKGHIYAAFIENEVNLPAIALVISGGHTLLIEVSANHKFKLLGSTLDDAIGETYDKVGRLMNLQFPAGSYIDDLAQHGTNNLKIPNVNVKNYNFSFSGIKTFMFNLIKENKYRKEDICCSFQNRVVDIVIKKAIKACQNRGIKNLIISGGVASNSMIRSEAKIASERFNLNLYIPSKRLCLDNGAMIASAGYYSTKNSMKNFSTKSFLSIEED